MKNNAYLNQIDDNLKEYIENLIKQNPQTYATDGANNRLIVKYFLDIYGIKILNTVSTKVHSITRIKSKFLEENPSYDRRDKERGKKTPSNKLNQQDEDFKS